MPKLLADQPARRKDVRERLERARAEQLFRSSVPREEGRQFVPQLVVVPAGLAQIGGARVALEFQCGVKQLFEFLPAFRRHVVLALPCGDCLL